jgi:hypothetical protein
MATADDGLHEWIFASHVYPSPYVRDFHRRFHLMPLSFKSPSAAKNFRSPFGLSENPLPMPFKHVKTNRAADFREKYRAVFCLTLRSTPDSALFVIL